MYRIEVEAPLLVEEPEEPSLQEEPLSENAEELLFLQEKKPEAEPKPTSFKSPSIPWSKIMEFPPPCIRISTSNLTGLRDTFRSCVTIRVVYIRVCKNLGTITTYKNYDPRSS